MKKKTSLLVSGTALLALLLTACGSTEGSKLSDVSYSMNGATAEPSVSFATPFAASNSEAHKIEEGQGDVIADGDNLLVDATVFNGADGASLGTTYTASPMIIPIGPELKEAAPELYEVLIGSKVGMSFSYTTNLDPAATAAASASPTVSPGTATNVEVYTVSAKLPKTAEGVQNEKKSAALKEFTLSDTGSAQLLLADDRGDAPTELYTEDLITGSGPVVKETDTVYVNYVGVTWNDGSTFDGNYGATPADFPLNQVIEGWTKGLAGKTVGSRVLLIIPSEMAYGENAAASGSPEGALVFVVDILHTSEVRTPASASASASESAAASETATASESASAEASATASPSASN